MNTHCEIVRFVGLTLCRFLYFCSIMWLLACSNAGLHMPIAISPSLSETFDPPKALMRDDTGSPINENTDRPAFDT